MSKEKDPMERMAIALEEFVGIQREAMSQIRLLLPRAQMSADIGIGQIGAVSQPALPGEAAATAPGAGTEARPTNGLREQAIESVLNTLRDDIEETGPQLLRAAMKEAMMESQRSTLEIRVIEEKLKKTRTKRLKRKKGCLFLEIGDGVEDPIEELWIRV